MYDTVSTVGVIGTEPQLKTVGNGLPRLTFRLGSNQRKFNRDGNSWENGDTNWYSVVAFRHLAENASRSLSKGDRVVVTGRLRVEEWVRDGRHGINVELVAEGIGHDLLFGTTVYTKKSSGSGASGSAGHGPESLTQGQPPAPAVDSDGWALPVVTETTGGPEASEPDDERGAPLVTDSLWNEEDPRQPHQEHPHQEQRLVLSDAEPPF